MVKQIRGSEGSAYGCEAGHAGGTRPGWGGSRWRAGSSRGPVAGWAAPEPGGAPPSGAEGLIEVDDGSRCPRRRGAPVQGASSGSIAAVGHDGGAGRLRPALITLEVVLALTLLIGAGLLIRSFASLRAVDPRFRTENVLGFRLFLSESRFLMLLLTVFAGVAVTLAATGIDGVLAYLVGQRTWELGIRLALGAARRQVLLLVLRDAMGSVVPGLLLGIAGALLLTRLLSAQLHGVAPTDPVTFAAVTALLLAVAMLPARRAANLEPMVTLR